MREFGRFRLAAASVFSGVILVAVGVFATTGLAHGPSAAEYQYNPSASQYRLTICHYTHSWKHPLHTITISVRAWHAHKRHGDTIGACTKADLATLTWVRHGHGWKAEHKGGGKQHGKSGQQHGSSGQQHGNSGGQGDSVEHGNGAGHGKSGQTHGHGKGN